MGLDLQKLKKKKKKKQLSNQLFFEWEKSLDIDFGPRATQSVKK